MINYEGLKQGLIITSYLEYILIVIGILLAIAGIGCLYFSNGSISILMAGSLALSAALIMCITAFTFQSLSSIMEICIDLHDDITTLKSQQIK